jgi:hypothetical protein
MAHPKGGSGTGFRTNHTFAQVYAIVGSSGFKFQSTTGEMITASQGLTKDRAMQTIVFMGERNRHGSVCESCWGFRVDCNGSRIGQCAEALDSALSSNKGTSIPQAPLGGSTTPYKPTVTDEATPDDLAHWRRSLLRLLDAIDARSTSGEGPVSKINRLSREARIPREIASCMRLVAEMRNVTEYEDKQLSPHEKAAAKNSWLSVESWARENDIKFKS